MKLAFSEFFDKNGTQYIQRARQTSGHMFLTVNALEPLDLATTLN